MRLGVLTPRGLHPATANLKPLADRRSVEVPIPLDLDPPQAALRSAAYAIDDNDLIVGFYFDFRCDLGPEEALGLEVVAQVLAARG